MNHPEAVFLVDDGSDPDAPIPYALTPVGESAPPIDADDTEPDLSAACVAALASVEG